MGRVASCEKTSPGCRPCGQKGKATSDGALSQVPTPSRVVEDPTHAEKLDLFARWPACYPVPVPNLCRLLRRRIVRHQPDHLRPRLLIFRRPLPLRHPRQRLFQLPPLVGQVAPERRNATTLLNRWWSVLWKPPGVPNPGRGQAQPGGPSSVPLASLCFVLFEWASDRYPSFLQSLTHDFKLSWFDKKVSFSPEPAMIWLSFYAFHPQSASASTSGLSRASSRRSFARWRRSGSPFTLQCGIERPSCSGLTRGRPAASGSPSPS